MYGTLFLLKIVGKLLVQTLSAYVHSFRHVWQQLMAELGQEYTISQYEATADTAKELFNFNVFKELLPCCLILICGDKMPHCFFFVYLEEKVYQHQHSTEIID